jgi:hypothetical protein
MPSRIIYGIWDKLIRSGTFRIKMEKARRIELPTTDFSWIIFIISTR